MEKTEESKPVAIRLSESRNAKVFDKKSLIHKEVFDKAFAPPKISFYFFARNLFLSHFLTGSSYIFKKR